MKSLLTAGRFFVGLPLACALLIVISSATCADAQVDTALVAGNAAATTFCHVEAGHAVARTFVDARVIGNPLMAEILVHERVHAEDMAADTTICAGRPRDVLRTEVHAYCVSDQFAAAMGAWPAGLYLATLNTLVHQFGGTDVPYHDVVSAWMAACGAQLGITSATKYPPPDSTPSRPAPPSDSTRPPASHGGDRLPGNHP